MQTPLTWSLAPQSTKCSVRALELCSIRWRQVPLLQRVKSTLSRDISLQCMFHSSPKLTRPSIFVLSWSKRNCEILITLITRLHHRCPEVATTVSDALSVAALQNEMVSMSRRHSRLLLTRADSVESRDAAPEKDDGATVVQDAGVSRITSAPGRLPLRIIV